jgi:catechol 2,3-dioxygenase-like lactoylglutathione lyase family enzyme
MRATGRGGRNALLARRGPAGMGLVSGAHAIVYSQDAEADRAFFRDVLGLPHVDAGGGWLIFALPPSELAVHPGEEGGAHELYLTCDDLKAAVKALTAKKAQVSPVRSLDWGDLVRLTLPGGGEIGLYQPKHPLAHG